MHIFFAGALNDLPEPNKTKSFYKKMAAVAEKLGHTYFWAFLNGTDPETNPDVPSRDVYNRDIAALDNSDIMIAYVGEPTTGTGIEVEHAHQTGKPVVLLYEKTDRVSRMLLGCPAVKKEIAFSSEEDALAQLETYLLTLKTA